MRLIYHGPHWRLYVTCSLSDAGSFVEMFGGIIERGLYSGTWFVFIE